VIVGIGIDLLANRRVEQELARGEWRQSDGIFSPEEVRSCNAVGRPARRYAECFAAKEAALKALGVSPDDLAVFREVEVGPGTIALHHRLKDRSEQLGVRRIRLSTSVSRDFTGAMVILES
jgi:holo-[acyl-carrier protein] synthase